MDKYVFSATKFVERELEHAMFFFQNYKEKGKECDREMFLSILESLKIVLEHNDIFPLAADGKEWSEIAEDEYTLRDELLKQKWCIKVDKND